MERSVRRLNESKLTSGDHPTWAKLSDFEIISKLGQGSYSSVYLVRVKSTSEELAMKKVQIDSLNDTEKHNTLNEIRFLASISSRYIVSYKGAFYDDASKTLCIIMDYVDGGDLQRKIRENQKWNRLMPEEIIWSYAVQMLKGLRTLHGLNIVHRDLKSANIFVAKDGKSIKIGDLNVAALAKNGRVYNQTGTPYYASPEVWRDAPYDHKSDIWSFGCVLYEMATGRPPFCAKDMVALGELVQSGIFQPIPCFYSLELNKLIARCLDVSQKTRPSCEDLLSDPIVIGHMDADTITSACDSSLVDINTSLLKTIKFPKNLRLLHSVLPRPKIRKSESFIGMRRDSSINRNQTDMTTSGNSIIMSKKECIRPQDERPTSRRHAGQPVKATAIPSRLQSQSRKTPVRRADSHVKIRPRSLENSMSSKRHIDVSLIRRTEKDPSSHIHAITKQLALGLSKRSITPVLSAKDRPMTSRAPRVGLNQCSILNGIKEYSRPVQDEFSQDVTRIENKENLNTENQDDMLMRRRSSIASLSKSRNMVNRSNSRSIITEKSQIALVNQTNIIGQAMPSQKNLSKKAFNQIISLVMEQKLRVEKDTGSKQNIGKGGCGYLIRPSESKSPLQKDRSTVITQVNEASTIMRRDPSQEKQRQRNVQQTSSQKRLPQAHQPMVNMGMKRNSSHNLRCASGSRVISVKRLF